MTHQSAPRGQPTGYINPQTPRLLNTSSLLWLSCFPQWHHQLWIPPLFQSLYLKTPCHFCPLVQISWLTSEAFQNVVPNDHTLLLIIPILGPPLKSGCLSSLTQARYVLRYLFLQLKKKLSIRPKPNSPSELNPYHLWIPTDPVLSYAVLKSSLIFKGILIIHLQ